MATEPPEPRHPEEGGGAEDPQPRGNPPGSARAERERAARIRRRKELFNRSTGRDPNHPVAGSIAWARKEGLLSLQDSIATLLGIAGDTSAAGALQAASEGLNTGLAAAQSAVERLTELTGQARTATEGNDNATQEIGSTSEHAAGTIEDLIDAINQAVQAATQATEHEQQFRSTCGDVGNRLAGS